MTASLIGDDPTLQMSSSSEGVYKSLKQKKESSLRVYSLSTIGEDLYSKIQKKYDDLRNTELPLTPPKVSGICDLVISLSEYYKKETVAPGNRYLLARKITKVLLLISSEIKKGGYDISLKEAVKAVHKHTQNIHVNSPEDPEYQESVDKIVHIRDYLDQEG